MSTHSVVNSDNLYPMSDVYIYVCECACVWCEKEKNSHTHKSLSCSAPIFLNPPPPCQSNFKLKQLNKSSV